MLNWKELLGRRTKRARRLAELYEGLYWDLAEEMAGMHKRFRDGSGCSGWRHAEAEGAAVAGAEAASGEAPPAVSIRGYFEQERGSEGAAGDGCRSSETEHGAAAVPSSKPPAPLPAFESVEAAILDGAPGLPPPSAEEALRSRRARAADALQEVADLEVSAQGALARQLTALGGLAVIAGRKVRYIVTKPEISLGRSTSSSQVDVDVSAEGDASRASRQAALIKLDQRGGFHLWNTGRKKLRVNLKEVGVGQSVRLSDGSLLEIGGLSFLFLLNAHIAEVFRKMQSGPGAEPSALRDDSGAPPAPEPGRQGGPASEADGTPEKSGGHAAPTPGA